MIEQKLFVVPEPGLAEAPSSWLPRAAASQAESTREFARFMGFSAGGDYDAQFVRMSPRHIAKACGFRADIFDVVHSMLELAQSLRMTSPVLLRCGQKPRYRYCPECLRTQSTPYFPIHWRIDAYRLCHIHGCLLEEVCPHCSRMIFPQRNWMRSGCERRGVSMASQCLDCSKFLWDVVPLEMDRIDSRHLSCLDRARLENGRPFVAALVHGRVVLTMSNVTDVRIGLKLIEKARMLAVGTKLGASHFRELQVPRSEKPPCRPSHMRAEEILESGVLTGH